MIVVFNFDIIGDILCQNSVLSYSCYWVWQVAGLAPLASNSFATAQKSHQTNFAGSKIEQLFSS
jgi:uncharacterized membrane protein YuzA (DUF378 family)